MRRTFFTVLCLGCLASFRGSLALAAPLPKSLEGVRLTPRFEKGKAIYVVVTAETKTTQTREAVGAPKTVAVYDRKQTFTMRWLPKEQDKAGNWIVGFELIGVEMESTIDYGDGKQIKKGPTENQGNPLSTLLQELKGTELTVRIRPDMTIAKIEGYEAVMQKLAADPLVSSILPKLQVEDVLRPVAEPLLAIAAPKPVAAGESWKRQSQSKLSIVGLGPIDGGYQANTEYAYEGSAKDLERVSSTTVMTYKSVVPGGGGLPSQMSSKKCTGTFLFDHQRGQLASSDTTVHMLGTLTSGPDTQPSTVELEQVQRTRMTTFDRNPLDKK